MKTSLRQRIPGLTLAACLGVIAVGAHAQEAPPAPAQVETPAPAAQPEAPPDVEAADTQAGAQDVEAGRRPPWERDDWRVRSREGDSIVAIMNDAHLAKDRTADVVVSILGSSTSEGIVSDAVVSIFGDTRVLGGAVGDAAVSVLGSTTVNAPVRGDVVAVLGDVTLGPEADVRGSVIVVGGDLRRDPAAQVYGPVQNVLSFGHGSFSWLRSWVDHCLQYLRPLAIAPGLGWAWGVALAFLGLYAFIALMFRETVDRCVATLEKAPGSTVIASLVAMLLTPVLIVLLCITVVGIVFVPVVAAGAFFATLFGKAVVLAWIGRSCTRLLGERAYAQTALAVLIGGAIVLVLYLVPVLGFLVYKVLGILAFGVVVYTLFLAARERRAAASPPPPPSYVSAAAAPGGFAAPGAEFAAASEPAGATGDASPGASATGAGADAGSAAAGGGATVSSASLDAAALPRAGFWLRMGALAIDAIIIGVVISLLENSKEIQVLALAAYGAIMWKLKGTTVGGIVFDLKLVRLDGRPIDWATAVVRALGCFLSAAVLFLGFIWIAFDENKQAWHDKIAGTVVVRVPKGVPLI